MSELSGKISTAVERTVLGVVETMAGVEARAVSRSDDPSDIRVEGVAGSVQFAGPLSGVVYLLMPELLAQRIAERMLGTTDVGPNEVKDVVGELTNMVAGGLKNDLAGAGLDSKLTIPTVIRAEQSRIIVRNVSLSTTNVIRLPGEGAELQVRVLAREMAA
jgi:chemotaxis protein CheX